jgi:signal transduction histidine kinase
VEFVETIVEAFRPYCEKKGLNLLTYTSPCLPVYLDLERFDKVLYNLLSNAMKFTPVGGTITVTVESAGITSEYRLQTLALAFAQSKSPIFLNDFGRRKGQLTDPTKAVV